jgi:hypothetical protein
MVVSQDQKKKPDDRSPGFLIHSNRSVPGLIRCGKSSSSWHGSWSRAEYSGVLAGKRRHRPTPDRMGGQKNPDVP